MSDDLAGIIKKMDQCRQSLTERHKRLMRRRTVIDDEIACICELLYRRENNPPPGKGRVVAIFEYLEKHEPCTLAEIRAALPHRFVKRTGPQKSGCPIYESLSNMIRQGQVQQNENKQYLLKQTNE